MDRRHFLKVSSIAGAGIILSKEIAAMEKLSARSSLVIATGSSPADITRAAIEEFGGISKFISRGDYVVIKPNMAWDREPKYASNTNPEVVAAVVGLCLKAGAKKVDVFDRTVNSAKRCYVQSGIAGAAEAAGATVSYIDDRKFQDIDLKGKALQKWPLYSDIFKADKVINIPIAKDHGIARLTMSMKNWMGVMGGRRDRIHQKLDQSLVDLAFAIKPTLTILDAVRILTDNGPQGGDLKDVKRLDTVIVGTDQVAIDSYGATLFDIKGSDLGYVRLAAEAGLGEMDLSRLDIRKISL
ncbi:MAG: DUF362 domain-containing protein [Nitrospira sp.]|nr:DUF362 domain-containing protein [Nitrospira sp.]